MNPLSYGGTAQLQIVSLGLFIQSSSSYNFNIRIIIDVLLSALPLWVLLAVVTGRRVALVEGDREEIRFEILKPVNVAINLFANLNPDNENYFDFSKL